MRSYSPYYDGPVPDSGRTIEEIERDIQAEKKRLESMSEEEWKAEMRKKYPLEAELFT